MIRDAHISDLDAIMPLFDRARAYMRASGNPSQWDESYPSREVITADIEADHCRVLVDGDGEIVGVFAFILGVDPTYLQINGGAWLNDEPYGVVHRLASSGKRGGVARECLRWCYERCRNLRVDTHADNRTLQHILETEGFVRCGIIYVRNHSPRIAYHKVIL